MGTAILNLACCAAIVSLAVAATTLHVRPPPPGRRTHLYQAPTADGGGAWIITADKPATPHVHYNEIPDSGTTMSGHGGVSHGPSHLPASFLVTSRPFGLSSGGGGSAASQPGHLQSQFRPSIRPQRPVYIDLGASEARPTTPSVNSADLDRPATDKLTSVARPHGVTNVDGHKLPTYNIGCTSGKKCSFIISQTTQPDDTTELAQNYDQQAVDSFLNNYADILNKNRTSSYLVQKMQTTRRHPTPMEAYLRDQKRKTSARVPNTQTTQHSSLGADSTSKFSPRAPSTPHHYVQDRYQMPPRPGTSGYYNSIPLSYASATRRRPEPTYRPFGLVHELRRYLQSMRRRSSRRLFEASDRTRDATRFDSQRHSINAHQDAAQLTSTRTLAPTGQIFRMRLSSGPITFRHDGRAVDAEYSAREHAGNNRDAKAGAIDKFVTIETDEGRRHLPNTLHPDSASHAQ